MFQRPGWLYAALAVLPALWAAYAWGAARREAARRAFGDPARLMPRETASRRTWRAALRLGAFALTLVALAAPQWGVELVSAESSARNVLILVDVSRSMTAEDVKPSRMDKAKSELAGLISKLEGQRVGVMAFAGQAAVMCPLTTDIEAAKQVLYALEPGAVPVQGTAIGEAVRQGAAELARYGGGKALVLLTDGEDHKTDPLGAAKEAAEAGVRVFAIGIGTPDGQPLPERDAGSGAVTGYVKDAKGATVISRLGEGTLIQMAKTAGGAYYRSTPGEEEALEIARALEDLEASRGRAGTTNRYKNRYQLPLALAFALLLAELLLPLSGPRRLTLPARTALLLLLAAPARSASTEAELRKGNSLYKAGKYSEALPRYERARKEGDPRPDFNTGAALYRLGEYKGSAESFAASKGGAAADYNRGNALMKAGDKNGAIEAFKQAVIKDPGDAAARHNLAVALRRKQDENKPNPKQGGGGGAQPPPKQSPPRPESQGGQQQQSQAPISREDAERLMRAVQEKEKQQKAKPKAAPRGKPPQGGEDW